MNTTRRRIAVSDIHGCAITFKALLKKLGLQVDDELYLLGDYIDRGPDSKGVIDFIWSLQRSGYKIQCLRGNHEQLFLDAVASSPNDCMDIHMLRSFRVNKNGQVPDQYIEWMSGLDYYFELPDYLLVHAGINFSAHSPLTDHYSLLWLRNWYDQIDRSWLEGRIVVHGHTPTRQSDIKLRASLLDAVPALDIDAGCVFPSYMEFGHLCAFDLDSRELHWQKRLD
ncbi:MAG TPA: metallophosphoesterase family protein [Saprospiraceae bacterium]|nr:metallophosphoesterase family protein [Saprospiraceae bacterium]HMQ82570.1 metallophosphoesterase family protein [Saprospiraceae bacterium]